MVYQPAERLGAMHAEYIARRRLEEARAAAVFVARDLLDAMDCWVATVENGDLVAVLTAAMAVAAKTASKMMVWADWEASRAIWSTAVWQVEVATLERELRPEISSFADGDDGEDAESPATIEESLDRVVHGLESAPRELREQLDTLHREVLKYTEQESLWLRLRQSPSWGQLEGIIPPNACAVIFRDLLVFPGVYKAHCKNDISVQLHTRRQARVLKELVLETDGTPGLSVEDRAVLLQLINKIDERGRNDPWSLVGDMPGRPTKDNATRTFTIRRLAREFSKYTDRPLHAVIARLAEAVLPFEKDGVDGHDVRTALRGWSPSTGGDDEV